MTSSNYSKRSDHDEVPCTQYHSGRSHDDWLISGHGSYRWVDFEIQSISEEELVRNALPILINELVLANNKLNTIASMSESIFPSSQEMYTKVRAIFNSAFHNVEIKLVLIPYMSNPNHLYEFLKKEGCLN